LIALFIIIYLFVYPCLCSQIRL